MRPVTVETTRGVDSDGEAMDTMLLRSGRRVRPRVFMHTNVVNYSPTTTYSPTSPDRQPVDDDDLFQDDDDLFQDDSPELTQAGFDYSHNDRVYGRRAIDQHLLDPNQAIERAFQNSSNGLYAPEVSIALNAMLDQILRATRNAQAASFTGNALPNSAPPPSTQEVKLGMCAICQEDDAPKEVVFQGCGHVCTCVKCTFKLVEMENNGDRKPNGVARCPQCRKISMPMKLHVV